MKVLSINFTGRIGCHEYVEIEFKKHGKHLIDTLGMITYDKNDMLVTSSISTEKHCKAKKKAVKFLLKEYEKKVY